MNIYREKLLDHYHNPRNYGTVVAPDGIMELENASCGDKIQISLKFENGVIIDAMFNGEGCAIAIASASMLTEYLKGRKLDDLEEFTLEDLQKLLGTQLTLSRLKCANLSLESAKKAANLLT